MPILTGVHQGFTDGSDDADIRRFLLVAFGVTWLLLLPSALAGAGVLPGPVPGWLHLLGGLGPALAGWVAARKAGLGAVWRNRLVARPEGAGSWIMALGTPVVLLGLGLAVTGGAAPETAPAAAPEPLAWGVLVGVAYAVLEEPGWRGYLLPRLQAGRGALAASLILGGIHVVWHAPMFLYRYPLTVGSVAGFSVSLMAGTLVFTHLFNRSGGSVPVTALFHAGWNVAILVGARGSDAVAGAMSVGLMLLAVVVVVRYGSATLARAPVVATAPGRGTGPPVGPLSAD